MQQKLALAMARTALAAYSNDPKRSGAIDDLTRVALFRKGTCRGFVGSNDKVVIVAFRGTDGLHTARSVVDVAQQWLRNLNFFQDVYGDVRVHTGFFNDFSRVHEEVGNLIVDHGGLRKPVLVTGHSAGAAIGTLAAHCFKRMGLNIDSAYVFASPRVGNRAFARALSVPVYRIENGDDLVPHVPLPPLAMWALDRLLAQYIDRLQYAFPNLATSLTDNFEYVHAGTLWYMDWDGSLVQPENLVQKIKLDTQRATRTFKTIGSQLLNGSFAFLQQHNMEQYLQRFRVCAGPLLSFRSPTALLS